MYRSFLESSANDTVMDASANVEFRISDLLANHRLNELNRRGEIYGEISSKFTFLMVHLNVELITEYCEKFAKFYPQDLG